LNDEGEDEWGEPDKWGTFWNTYEEILPIKNLLEGGWIYPPWYTQEDKKEHIKIMQETSDSMRDQKLMAFAKKMRKKKRLAQNRVSTSL